MMHTTHTLALTHKHRNKNKYLKELREKLLYLMPGAGESQVEG